MTAVAGIVGLVACDGGGGTLVYSAGSWDDDHGNLSDRERPLGVQDPPENKDQPPDTLPAQKDKPSLTGGGGTGGARFSCSGIYECAITGRLKTCTSSSDSPETNCTVGDLITIRVRIELQNASGVCKAGKAVLESNGTFHGDDDDESGIWRPQGNGFFIQVGESSGICIPSSGPVGLVDINGQTVSGTGSSTSSSSTSSSTSSSSGAGTGNGDISIDPGTGGSSSTTSGSP